MDAAVLKMKQKIVYALANAKTLSKYDLQKIHNEALEFGNSLPLIERGDFFWTSGIETLGMQVKALKQK